MLKLTGILTALLVSITGNVPSFQDVKTVTIKGKTDKPKDTQTDTLAARRKLMSDTMDELAVRLEAKTGKKAKVQSIFYAALSEPGRAAFVTLTVEDNAPLGFLFLFNDEKGWTTVPEDFRTEEGLLPSGTEKPLVEKN